MTNREENIVNISLRAAELLKDGRIERDDISGHAGLTEFIISLAEKFEEVHIGVDWNSEDRDYWIEIDNFAERELIENYGRELPPVQPELAIKVIICDGFVEGALKNVDVPVSVEVVDVDRNYENYRALEEYREELYKDRSLMSCDCVFVGQEELENALGVDGELFQALGAYGYVDAKAIDSEWLQQHKEAFLYAFREGVEDIDLDFWIQYEELLGEKLTYDEYVFVDMLYEGDPLELIGVELSEEERQVFAEIKTALFNHRAEQLRQNEDPVKVYAVSGSVKHEIYSGNLDECRAFCEENRWAWVDENQFQWDMEMEDSRDGLLPDGYFDALSYYSDKVGVDIENEFVRAHAEELVYCYHHEKEIVDFDFWTRYEMLCGEKLTFEEYRAIDSAYDGDPHEIADADFITVGEIKQSLSDFRTALRPLSRGSGLDQLIDSAKAQASEKANQSSEKEQRSER